MAEITSGTPIAAPAAPVAASTVSVLQKIENTVFAFLQAHYAKLVSAGVGFAAAKVGIFTIVGKFL
jgi:hypothetical protein